MIIENWPSILPPLIAIVLAIKTRQIILSLALGTFVGLFLLILEKPDAGVISGAFQGIKDIPVWRQIVAFFDGILTTIRANVDVFKNPGNTRNIIFTALVGSMIALMQTSGGTKGFVDYFSRKNFIKSDKGLQLYTVLLGSLIMIENNISSLVTGAVVRPFYEKRNINKAKLAYILDSTAAPICILIPLNAWWANIAQHLMNNGVRWDFGGYLSAYAFNFYAIITILFNVAIILIGRDYFSMKKYVNSKSQTTTGTLGEGILHAEPKAGVKPKAFNFLIPILSMIIILPLGLWITGGGDMLSQQASGSESVLFAVMGAVIISIIAYRIQKIMSISEMMELVIRGFGSFISISIILMLSFAIGQLCSDLKIGQFFAKIIGNSRAAGALIPAGLFLVSSLISFSTGTSWGTWAIMIPIATGLVSSSAGNIYISIGAVLGGAIFGDHSSPISDTTIISSAAAGCDVIDHVKTQLPYALLTGGISLVLYVIFGWVL